MDANEILEQVLAADENGTPCGTGSSVVYKNTDGIFTVCDNGEEVSGLTAEQAARIVMENDAQ